MVITLIGSQKNIVKIKVINGFLYHYGIDIGHKYIKNEDLNIKVNLPQTFEFYKIGDLDDKSKDTIYKGLLNNSFRNIDKSDLVIVCNFNNGYIGNSTLMEIGYTIGKGKKLVALERNEDPSVNNMFDMVIEDYSTMGKFDKLFTEFTSGEDLFNDALLQIHRRDKILDEILRILSIALTY